MPRASPQSSQNGARARCAERGWFGDEATAGGLLCGAQADRETGLEKLRLTAEKGHYLLPYARLILAVADIRDKAPQKARLKLEWLAQEFPGNRLYREELAKLR